MNNSLEAIISITAILIFITIILFGLSIYKNRLNESEQSFSTKTNSNNCAIIIDSFFSNSAEEYNTEFKCNGKKNFVFFKQNIFLKKSFVLTKIKKEKMLEIETNEHYIN